MKHTSSLQKKIEEALRKKLKPKYLEILNESGNHSRGNDSHFRVRIVSADFSGKNAVQRHRIVYDTLKEEMAQGIHALAIQAWSLEEWEKEKKTIESPLCAHSSRDEN